MTRRPADHPAGRVVARDLFLPPLGGRGVFPGPVGYTRADAAALSYLYGRVDHSDAYDDYVEIVSDDNGRTWSDPVLRFRGEPAPGGRLRWCEPAAFFDADTGLRVGVIKRALYPDDRRVQGLVWELFIGVDRGDPWRDVRPADLGVAGGVGTSFCRPVKTSRGRILVPAQKPRLDAAGGFVHHRGYWSRAYEALAILGDYGGDGGLTWRAGGAVGGDLERTCRGLCEPTVVELADGRLAMICRGDNGAFPERPGCKWVAFSDDDGESWSAAEPLGCTEGDPIESPSSGSTALRSIATGRLYWIGNLCIDGVRPEANWPRSPLVIAELSEAPLAIRRETIAVIDRAGPPDGPATQLSNFRCYQDRATGEVVLLMTRFGEADADDWRRAGHYRYRVALGD